MHSEHDLLQWCSHPHSHTHLIMLIFNYPTGLNLCKHFEQSQVSQFPQLLHSSSQCLSHAHLWHLSSDLGIYLLELALYVCVGQFGLEMLVQTI